MSPRAKAAVVAALYLGVVVAALSLVACGGSQPAAVTAAQQADLAAYAVEEQDCVAMADGSLAAANACIHAVQARWCNDGGQLAGHCAGPDGGAP